MTWVSEPSPPAVVLLEDDPAVLTLLRDVLESAGFSVQAFTRPFQALASIRRQVPAVLVLDWHLPDLDGRAVLERMRDFLGRLPPVLVLTGDVRLRPPPEVAEVLRKPVSLTLFVEHVRALAAAPSRPAQSRSA